MKIEELKLKKVILIIAILIIVAGGVVISTIGFNVGLDYSESQNIKIYFETEYDKDGLKQIVNDVFGNETRKFQDIEYFDDAVSITVKTASENQINSLEEKIIQEYNIDDIESHVIINNVPNYRLRDLIKLYIIPLVITTVVIFAYLGIRFRKLGVKKAVLLPLGLLSLLEMIYISIIAICRIPFGRLVIPIALLIYIAIMVYILARLSKMEETKVEPKKK